MLPTSALEYDLPERLIATRPCEPRDAAKMLVVSRSDPARLEHRRVCDLPELLGPGDAFITNRTRVLPARFFTRRRITGGRAEGLFLETRSDEQNRPRWYVMIKSNGRLRSDVVLDLVDPGGDSSGVSILLLERDREGWIVEPRLDDAPASEPGPDLLARAGATPLPPYILRARRQLGMESPDERDRAWYQTVFAEADQAASVAAPTAGLHFTPELLDRMNRRGLEHGRVILHVGAGTFRPIESSHVQAHPMHSERFVVPAETLELIHHTRAQGRAVVAIGTTTARALESAPVGAPAAQDACGETTLLIAPGHLWSNIDGLLTNFHLPRSTLLAMVGALFPDGIERLLAIYHEAIRQEYRFYSYGDAMLILP